jgi:hypothetical protein
VGGVGFGWPLPPPTIRRYTMRFVSINPKLGLGTVVKEKFVLALDGQRDQTQDSVSVQFSQEYLTQDDINFALHFFPENRFTGRYLEADSVTLEPLAQRIGVFDTVEEQARQGWDDATTAKVEQYLLAKPNYGQDFVQAGKVEAVAGIPWASYDTTHHFKIPGLAAELGLLHEALAWEQANKNRDSVISGLEEKLAIPADAVQGEVVAA